MLRGPLLVLGKGCALVFGRGAEVLGPYVCLTRASLFLPFLIKFLEASLEFCLLLEYAERTQTTRAHQEETSGKESEEDTELESDDNPEMYLQGTEREFAELVLEAEWIKSGEIREKMVTDAHDTLHQGPMGTFRKLLHDSYFWSDMKRDCRRASQKCKQCLCHNVRK